MSLDINKVRYLVGRGLRVDVRTDKIPFIYTHSLVFTLFQLVELQQVLTKAHFPKRIFQKPPVSYYNHKTHNMKFS